MFKDENLIADYALAAVKRVVAAGLMKGDMEGTFRPKDPITREDLAVILDREILLEQELEDEDRLSLFKQVANSVVEIHAGDALGSGVIINAGRSLALTNAHVVGDQKQVEVVWKSVYKSDKLPMHVGPMADVLAVDEAQDLALIQIHFSNLPLTCRATIAADWKDNDYTNRNHIGRRLYIQGSPLGFGGRLSEAIFNGIRVMETTYLDLEGHINPGNSGGPIFNTEGELVGLVCAKLVGEQVEGFGLGIPLSRIVPFLQANGEM